MTLTIPENSTMTHGTRSMYNHGSCRCAECTAANNERSVLRRRQMVLRSDAEIAATRARLRPDGKKVCRVDRKRHPLTNFDFSRREEDGLSPMCYTCEIAYKRVRRELRKLTPQVDGKWPCAYGCGREGRTVDHVVPAYKGGKTDVSNCVLACMDCNIAKGTKHPLQFLLDSGRVLKQHAALAL